MTRYLLAIGVTLIVLTGSAFAQNETSSNSEERSMGGASCGEVFECDPSNISGVEVGSLAERCIKNNFGAEVGGSSFSSRYAGSDNCIRSYINEAGKSGYRCCILSKENKCALRCDAIISR